MTKISLTDLLPEEIKIKDINNQLRNAAYQTNREDLFIAKPKNVKPEKHFYELVPENELEKSINEILKRQSADPMEIEKKRRQNEYIFEFDRKMKRIKKIKSRKYRKLRRIEKLQNKLDSLANDDELDSDSDTISDSDSDDINKVVKRSVPEKLLKKIEVETSDIVENNPILSFEGKEEEVNISQQRELVKQAFAQEDADDFNKEKEEKVLADMPVDEEIVLPGWGGWGGCGIETKKTKVNTIKRKSEGIIYTKRKDYNLKNVIINENILGDKKYSVKLPFGYTKEEYLRKIKTPISKECNTLRMFTKFIKPTEEEDLDPFGTNEKRGK
ncbi:U3 small nucleolar RNA-associated protein 14 like protein C [Astathelohania contejeani]|uniref:U3 small nucleolar RNA-associated protein 14 like protein C n=1 Tax=Astathelohania contejeani TaxID=164912 RepID=A0ABQ7HZB7_9MICR|nr:U3 small nucleolar RNA-associated protein 14 like protein C [Thelohania contejeani]